jgi:glycosyltransferase involved in cell wall biosynthesis
MHWRTISGLALLAAGLAAPAVAASRAALADAAEHGDKTSIRLLLGTGNDVNAPQVDGTTALHWAAYRDDAETVELLVRAGANGWVVAPTPADLARAMAEAMVDRDRAERLGRQGRDDIAHLTWANVVRKLVIV